MCVNWEFGAFACLKCELTFNLACHSFANLVSTNCYIQPLRLYSIIQLFKIY